MSHEHENAENARPENTPKPDNVLDLISDVESQLADLRRVQGERAQAEERVAQQERELIDRERSVSTQLGRAQEELEQNQIRAADQQRELEQRSAEFDSRERSFAEEVGRVEDMRDQLSQRDEHIARTEAEIADQREERQRLNGLLEEKQARTVELGAQAERVEATERELDVRSERVEELELELASHAEQYTELNRESVGLRERAVKLENELTEHSERSARAENELVERTRSFEAAEARVEERMSEATKQNEQAAAREREFGDRSREREAQIEELNDRIRSMTDEHRSAVDAREQELSRTRRDHASAREKLDERDHDVESLRAQVEQLRGEVDELAGQTQQMAGEAGKSEVEAAGAIDGLREHAALLEAQLEDYKAQVDNRESQLMERDARIAEMDGFAVDRDARLVEQERELERMRAELVSPGSESDATRDRLEQMERDRDEAIARAEQVGADFERVSASLAERRDRCDALERAGAEGGADDEVVERLRAQVGELRLEIESSDVRAEGYRAKADEFRTHLEAREVQVEELEQEITAGGGSSPARSDEFNTFRRERLRRVRHAVDKRAEKVQRGTEALRGRFERCERLLKQREELVAVRAALEEAQNKVEESKVRSHMFTNLLSVVAMVATLAAFSWVGARQIVPGEYAVKTVIAADANGRTASPQELEDWRAFHVDMLEDPRFLETAAARMKRRGITTLGTASELKAMLARDFDYDDSKPGELTFELRGIGSSRTERILETFATALVGHANAARQLRADSTITMISMNAEASREPIDHDHLIYAGTLFGGGVVLVGVMGVYFWRRLKFAKVKFEQQDQIDLILDQARWGDPTAGAKLDRAA